MAFIFKKMKSKSDKLVEACQKGDVEMVEKLISKGVNINAVSPKNKENINRG